MTMRTKFWHFKTSGGFYGEILSNTGLTDTPENRATALTMTDNGCYHFIVFIKETNQIYTHGNLYDCSSFTGSDVNALLESLTSGEINSTDTEDIIAAKLLYLINDNTANISVNASAISDLATEVAENEEVATAAIEDLYNKVNGTSSGAVATLQDNLEDLQTQVNENEEVTTAAINNLYERVNSPLVGTYVKYTEQTLTEDQKLQARTNIEAASVEYVDGLIGDINTILDNINGESV